MACLYFGTMLKRKLTNFLPVLVPSDSHLRGNRDNISRVLSAAFGIWTNEGKVCPICFKSRSLQTGAQRREICVAEISSIYLETGQTLQ